MKRAVIAFILIACTIAAVVCLRVKPANAGLPIVQTALPKHGFVCVPAITPRAGPVRSREIV